MESTLQDVNKYFKNPKLLGVFVSNHDNARFLNINGNTKMLQGATAFSLMTSNNYIY